MTETGYSIELKEVTPRVVVATDNNFYSVNAAGVALENFIVIIDTLLYPSQSRKLRAFMENKYSLPIKYVFYTHIDGDHVFGADTFRDAEFIASKHLGPKMKEKLKDDWNEDEFEDWRKQQPEHTDAINEIVIHSPSISFDKEYVISDGSTRIELYHSGGHTSCSSWAYIPHEKVVLTGDILASFDWPYISDQTGSPDGWIESFEHIMFLDANIIIPGHGRIVDKNHLNEHLDYIKKLRTLVKEAIINGKGKDDFEVPDFYPPAADWQIPRALEHLFKFYSS